MAAVAIDPQIGTRKAVTIAHFVGIGLYVLLHASIASCALDSSAEQSAAALFCSMHERVVAYACPVTQVQYLPAAVSVHCDSAGPDRFDSVLGACCSAAPPDRNRHYCHALSDCDVLSRRDL
jgi:hypothetical protein